MAARSGDAGDRGAGRGGDAAAITLPVALRRRLAALLPIPPRWRRWVTAGACFLVALLVARFLVLPPLPDWLMARDIPRPSDMVIALGGDASGSREAGAARLWQEGHARAVLCSGRDLLWRTNEADAMAAHVRALGVPADRILRSRSGASTIEEAARILPLARSRGVRSVLLVTTSPHSRRARTLFRRAWRNTGIRVLSCPVESPYFRRERWWTRVRDRHVMLVELLSWVRVGIGR
jgi:uncharacterized SAM-binding protein YcdF (DUF218 family)